MGRVALEGIRFYAFHGFYQEEQKTGNYFIVDVYVDASIEKAASGDELAATVNYETIYRVCKLEMDKPSKLLEHVARRIIDRIVYLCTGIEKIKVRISKQNPPMGAQIDRAFIEFEDQYIHQCGKCNRRILVVDPKTIWTDSGHVLPETQQTLQRKFGPIICSNCLAPHVVHSDPIT